MADSRSVAPSAFVRWTAAAAVALTAVNIAGDLMRAPLREALTPGLAMHVGLLATMASLLVRSRRLKAALAVLGLVVVSAAFLLNRVR